MTSNWIEKVTGSLEDKRRYRDTRTRVARLPEHHRIAVEALERYLNYFGSITRGDILVRMYDDLVTLFEQSAADGIGVRAVVGNDPVEFIETFLETYDEARWINKERLRLIRDIDRAADLEPDR